MKKYIGALVLLSVLAGLSGCQSKQVTAADAAIAAIGEVSLASEAQILQAESAVEALGPEERADLQNLQILQDARSVYDGLVLEDQADRISRQISALGEITPDSLPAVKAAEKAYADAPQPVKDLVKNHEQLEAARETLTALEAEKIERQIEDIGDVTLGSKSVVAAARKAYEEAAEAVREKIQNLHILQEAESRLRQLEEEDQLKQDQEAASRVEKEIQALGTIRYDSEEKIQAVQKAFDALSPGAKKLVSNVKKLQDAPAALVKAREQKLNANFARMRKDPDPFQNVVF